MRSALGFKSLESFETHNYITTALLVNKEGVGDSD